MRGSMIEWGAVSLLAVAAAVAASPVSAAPRIAAEEEEERERERRGSAPDIVVTARSLQPEEKLPVRVLTGDELAHRRQGGLGETLAGLPGIHLDNFGGGASRPVIRGQTVPRIEVLTNGATLFDVSSVSPDHAIATDPLLLDAIEVQRGPAAIRYGGNAVNGAIDLIDGKVPRALPPGGLTGATEVRYGTGDREKTVVGRVTAGAGPFAVHAEGARRRAGDYAVPRAFGSDRLRDSFANLDSWSAGASWITARGYLGAAYTRIDGNYGLPGHSHANAVCHPHGIDLHCEPHDEPDPDAFETSDDGHTASIDLRSERVDVRADYDRLLPGMDHARLRLSYTDYDHGENDGPFLFARYRNRVYDGRIELTHAPLLGFSGTFGAQYTHGTFSGLDVNNAFEGFDEAYDFRTENLGLFLTERRGFGPVDVELGIRRDRRRTHAVKKTIESHFFLDAGEVEPGDFRDLLTGIYDAFYADNYPRARHDPLSLSAGATWHPSPGHSLALTIARTQRAPGVRELYALGNNLATDSYEIGLARTTAASDRLPAAMPDVLESNRSIDLTLRRTIGATRVEVGLFHQRVRNYVLPRLLEEERESGRAHRLLVYELPPSEWSIDYDSLDQGRTTHASEEAQARGDHRQAA